LGFTLQNGFSRYNEKTWRKTRGSIGGGAKVSKDGVCSSGKFSKKTDPKGNGRKARKKGGGHSPGDVGREDDYF